MRLLVEHVVTVGMGGSGESISTRAHLEVAAYGSVGKELLEMCGRTIDVVCDAEERTALILFSIDHGVHLQAFESLHLEAMKKMWVESNDVEQEAYRERAKMIWRLL